MRRPVVALLSLAALAAASGGGCLKPERDTLAQQRAEALRKRQMAAPTEQGAVMESARARRSRLDDDERALPVATIAGRPLTLGEFEARYDALPLHLRYAYGSADGMRRLLDQIVDVELMQVEARRMGLDRDPRVMQPVKVEMVRSFLRNELPARAEVEAVTDAEVEAAYGAHPERYATPVVVTAAQIVTLAEDATAMMRRRILEETEGDPEQRIALFRRLAGRHSVDDATGAEGGLLGTFASGPVEGIETTPDDEVPAALREAALALDEVGELSPVIPVGTRYHVLIAVERSGGRRLPLDEVEGTIRNRLYRARQDAALDRFVSKLRAAADVEIDADALARVRRPEQAPTPEPAPNDDEARAPARADGGPAARGDVE